MESVWYLNMADLNKDWKVALVFVFFFCFFVFFSCLLMKNCEESYKSIDFYLLNDINSNRLYRGKEKIHRENKVDCLSTQVLQSD